MSKAGDHARWGKDYGSTEPWPDGEPLSSEQVSQLEDGQEIIVRWGGGNGPHRYVVTAIHDTLYARSTYEDEQRFREHLYKWSDPLWPSYLTSYGDKNWHSKVWIASS